jgi:hypothetical protein
MLLVSVQVIMFYCLPVKFCIFSLEMHLEIISDDVKQIKDRTSDFFCKGMWSYGGFIVYANLIKNQLNIMGESRNLLGLQEGHSLKNYIIICINLNVSVSFLSMQYKSFPDFYNWEIIKC